MMSTLVRLGLLSCAFGLPACTSAPPGPVPLQVIRDVEYVVRDKPLALDLYVPKEPHAQPLPAVIWIHGGAWRSGSKSESGPVQALAQRGFVGVSVDFRPSTQAPCPAAIEDVLAAVSWIRRNATRYGIDPDKIGLWGASSGGHLALLASCLGDPGRDVSSRVQATCAWYAPTDLSNVDLSYTADAIQLFLGDSMRSTKAHSASPVTFASADDPPVLLIHGEEDLLVPPSHSQTMAEALNRAGGKARVILVEHATHGFEPQNGEASPSKEEILEETIEFFEEQLK